MKNNNAFFILIFLIFSSLTFVQAQAFTYVNNGGDVTYTSNLSNDDMHFYLFGDGYYTKEKDPFHEFNQSATNYVTKLYHAGLYKPEKPQLYQRPIQGGSSNSVWSPPVIPMQPGVDTETSWNITKLYKNFILIKFENTTNAVSNGCVEFHYATNEMTVWPSETLNYNAWADQIDAAPGLVTYTYSNLLPGEQRVLYLPVRSQRDPGFELTYSVCMKENCSGAGICRETRSVVHETPHDPNEIKITNTSFLSNSENLNSKYGTPIQYLDYYYQFFNDGNAPAINVDVDIFFDMAVDLSTIEIIDAKYDDVYFNLSGQGDVTFYFDDIYLPGINQSSDPGMEDCTSWVKFRICLVEQIYSESQCLGTLMDIYFDNLEPVSTNHIICALSDGAYTKNPCNSEITENHIQIDTELNQNAIAPEIQLFPNPAQNEISFLFNDLENSRITIFSATGKQVFSTILDNQGSYELDLTEFKEGLYFAKFNTQGQTVTKRFIKQ